MYFKAVVMEIKNDCCIVMLDDGQIVKIKKKEGLRQGQKIYVLKEDFIEEKKKAYAIGAAAVMGKTIKKSTLTKIAAAAAAFVIFAGTIALPKVTDPVYATVSFDGERSVQLELDKDNCVLDAKSYDNTLTGAELDEMEGKQLDELWGKLESMSTEGESFLVAGAPMRMGAYGASDELENIINENLSGSQLICLQGDKRDVKEADRQGKSLGIYILDKAVDEDTLNEYFDEVPVENISGFLTKNQDKLNAAYRKMVLGETEEDDDAVDSDNDDAVKPTRSDKDEDVDEDSTDSDDSQEVEDKDKEN